MPLPRMNPATSLRASSCIDSDARNVAEKAAALTAPHPEARDKARRLFEFVRDEVAYNFAPEVRGRSHFRASHTLELGNGFCMQKAALFAALCRASGIPARIGFQNIVDYMITGKFLELMGTNELVHHGMNAIYLEGRWIQVDATLDRGLVERKQYRLVEFDGRHDALLPKTDRRGRPHFAIMKCSGFYNDTPQFAMRSMLDWVKEVPYDDWRRLVHGKDGSM
jgi:transglutaminase-like putative cysteine protease